jgi:DNA-binding response OmpR family regulator
VPTRTLESHASRIRRKLAAAGLANWVVNVWGVGYKLRPLPSLAGDGSG